MEIGTTLTLSEFERQTLAYILFSITQSGHKGQDVEGEEEWDINFVEGISGDEMAALRRIQASIYRA